jgi:phenylacetyl-CoA:acceptor oxidoreductase subunit 1
MSASTTPRYGMVVDINRCVGCQTCTISCKHANATPPGVQWRRVLDVERGRFPDVERLFLVTGCQHCENPPCVPVCPTGATKQREDGLVTMDYETCIGCGYCAVACPYQARTIVHDKQWYYGEPTLQEDKVYDDGRIGVANKCTFCVERIDEAKVLGKTPGVDLEYTPACAASCIAQAIVFGDYNDPESSVSKLTAENNYFQMHQELGTDPQIKYLYEVPQTMPGHNTDAYDLSDERLSDPENPLVGKRQTFWDFRAAMNFTLGGMSSGLMIVAFLSYLLGGVSENVLQTLFMVAGIGMAIGLFFVFLEIGRKERFLNVLKRPQTSWMTRETYAVAIIYPGLVAGLIWPHGIFHWLVFLGGVAFLYCQAMILHAAKGIPAWRAPLIPFLLIASGLFEGIGLLMMVLALIQPQAGGVNLAAFAGVVLAIVNVSLWRSYRNSARLVGIGPLADKVLAGITPALHFMGHAVPLALLALGVGAAGDTQLWMYGLGGLAAVLGGVLWKFTVITRACYQQGFAVPRLPQRGSGKYAAPLRLEGFRTR